MRCTRKVAVLGIGLLIALAEPRGEARSPSRGWVKGHAAIALIEKTLARCSGLGVVKDLPETDDDDPEPDVRALRRGGGLLVEILEAGQGVSGSWTAEYWQVEVQRCTAIGMSATGNDGEYVVGYRHRADRRGPASAAERAKLAAAFDHELAEPDHPRHGAARLFVEERCLEAKGPEHGWFLSPVLKPTQVWRTGRPRGSKRTLWSAEQLKSLGLSAPGSAGAGPVDGLLVMAQEPPATKVTRGRFRIYESVIRGRNAGAAVAIHDTILDRHCWAVETRECLSGGIRWLRGDDELAIGLATPSHPVYLEERGSSLFVIHLPTCRAHRLVGAHLRGKELRDGKNVSIPIAAIKRKLAESR